MPHAFWPSRCPIKAQLLLLTRHGCHLCEEMAADLAQLAQQWPGLSWQLADVDSRSDWRAQWGSEVPVLLRQQADGVMQELCRHHLQADALLWHLGEPG